MSDGAIIGVRSGRSGPRSAVMRVTALLATFLVVAGVLVVGVGAAGPVDATTVQSTYSPEYAGAPELVIGQQYAQNMPDPTIVFDGTTYWAYTTSTGGPLLPVFSSPDLQRWTVRSDATVDAFPTKPSWVSGSADAQWAPGVIVNGTEWLVYSSWLIADGRRCISVAVGPSAIGPFVDGSATPLVCDDGGGSIDPMPYRVPDGRLYLTWKAESGPGRPTLLRAAQLTSDGRSLSGSPVTLLQPSQTWERGGIENPSMAILGGSWWLLYSGAAWDSANYRMGAARCSGPLGPCSVVSADPLFGNTSTELGPGGGSFFTDARGATRIAYHVWNAPYSNYPRDPNCDGNGHCTSQGQRFLRIEGVVAADGRLTVDPVGMIDRVVPGGGSIVVDGWAFDPSTTGSIPVHVYVDGVVTAITANRPRGDLESVFPGIGSAHGYTATIAAGFGEHQVCVFAMNAGPGTYRALGCRTVSVTSGPPFGSLDIVSAAPGSISVTGWAIDPDTSGPVMVHVYVFTSFTEATSRAVLADQPRADVGTVFPGFGAGHGFTATYPTSPGLRAACAFAINVGEGSHTLLGCRLVIVPDASPFGSLDIVSTAPGSISMVGWSIDPDAGGPNPVRLYVFTTFTDATFSTVVANQSRPDVAGVVPGYGAAHGYSATVASSPGLRAGCAVAVNVNQGTDTVLGCKLVVVS